MSTDGVGRQGQEMASALQNASGIYNDAVRHRRLRVSLPRGHAYWLLMAARHGLSLPVVDANRGQSLYDPERDGPALEKNAEEVEKATRRAFEEQVSAHIHGRLGWLIRFVVESNRIEGVHRAPTEAEVNAHYSLLQRPQLTIADIEAFVDVVQPGAKLWGESGMNVRVGDHFPPEGGPLIRARLDALLMLANGRGALPYAAHHEYETLHPFMDGNGRSGRVVWLWMMKQEGGPAWQQALELGFLHTWYYQSLQARRED
jgi:hypothetical protein